LEIAKANRRAELMRKRMQASAEAHEAAGEALAQVVRTEEAAQEEVVAQAEQAREEAEAPGGRRGPGVGSR
jgi:hypothetical protein